MVIIRLSSRRCRLAYERTARSGKPRQSKRARNAYGLLHGTGRILMEMHPDQDLTDRLRRNREADGDRLTDPHVGRAGPGRLATGRGCQPDRERLRHFPALPPSPSKSI
jgi:hypothetical protein